MTKLLLKAVASTLHLIVPTEGLVQA